MKRVIILGLILAAFLADPGTGSPLKGKASLGFKKMEKESAIEFEEIFRGGERACVIVQGDHNPIVDLELSVFDSRGKLVAKEERSGDLLAAIWYPPRDAVYKIRLVNPGTDFNVVYISLK
jgi:hypothetical protein